MPKYLFDISPVPKTSRIFAMKSLPGPALHIEASALISVIRIVNVSFFSFSPLFS
jgi:hypothetical protein